MPSKDLMPLRTDRQPIGYSNELVGRAGEAPMPGVAEAVVAVREPLQPGTPEGWCNPRPRRRNVPQQLLRIKFLGKLTPVWRPFTQATVPTMLSSPLRNRIE